MSAADRALVFATAVLALIGLVYVMGKIFGALRGATEWVMERLIKGERAIAERKSLELRIEQLIRLNDDLAARNKVIWGELELFKRGTYRGEHGALDSGATIEEKN